MLLGAVLLVGGGAALTRFVRRSDVLAGSSQRAFNAEQFALLEQVCEVIIPTTDTPGAIAAGVPAFMRQMLEEWGTESSRAEVASVLEAVEKLTWHRFGAAFLELGPERRLEVIAAFDAERIAEITERERRIVVRLASDPLLGFGPLPAALLLHLENAANRIDQVAIGGGERIDIDDAAL